MKTLLLTLRSDYGQKRYYPACEASKLLLQLGRPRKRSFTEKEIGTLRELGCVLKFLVKYKQEDIANGN